MTDPKRCLLFLLLPAVFLLGSNSVPAAALPLTWDPKPGLYLGTVNMTILNQGSTDTPAGVRDWFIDMPSSEGNIDIQLSSDRRYSIVVDLPVPIDTAENVTIKDENAECKGWSITGSGFGTARGTAKGQAAPPLVPPALAVFRLPLQFALSSLSARIRKNGNCPSESWGPDLRKAVDSEFGAVFGSQWTFTATAAGAASLSGTCASETWGKAKGQTLECSWRAYWVPSE